MDKPKTTKVVTLEGTFPDCLIKHAYQQGRGEGSSLRIAAARAMTDLMSKPGLRAKHLKSAKIVMSIGTRVEPTEESA
jgi:hypothetical protein